MCLRPVSPRSSADALVSLWRCGRLPVERLIDGTAGLSQINEVVKAQQAGDVVRTILTPAGASREAIAVVIERLMGWPGGPQAWIAEHGGLADDAWRWRDRLAA